MGAPEESSNLRYELITDFSDDKEIDINAYEITYQLTDFVADSENYSVAVSINKCNSVAEWYLDKTKKSIDLLHFEYSPLKNLLMMN